MSSIGGPVREAAIAEGTFLRPGSVTRRNGKANPPEGEYS